MSLTGLKTIGNWVDPNSRSGCKKTENEVESALRVEI